MGGRRRTAAITRRHPPPPLQRRAPRAVRHVAVRPLVDVAVHVAHAERAHALLRLVGRFTQIEQGTPRVEQLRLVVVALVRVARISGRVRVHLFPLAREVPLALVAEALAFALARGLARPPSDVDLGQRRPLVFVLVAIDAEALVHPLADALARAVLAASPDAVGLRRLHPVDARLSDLGAVLPVDEHHLGRARRAHRRLRGRGERYFRLWRGDARVGRRSFQHGGGEQRRGRRRCGPLGRIGAGGTRDGGESDDREREDELQTCCHDDAAPRQWVEGAVRIVSECLKRAQFMGGFHAGFARPTLTNASSCRRRLRQPRRFRAYARAQMRGRQTRETRQCGSAQQRNPVSIPL